MPASSLGRILLLWLTARGVLSLWVLLCSTSHPVTALEKTVAAWPPQPSVGLWWDRVLLEPWNRWDVEHYLKIAAHGYRADDGTSSFHPLYPLLGKAVGALVGNHDLLGLFLVSSLSSLLLLMALEGLARLDLSRDDAFRSCSVLLMLPGAFALFAPYTESLFLCCSIASLLMARQGRWWSAGLVGGLAVLTRQQGILLIVPLGWELWAAVHGNWRTLRRRWSDASGLLLTPLTLSGWLLYRNMALSDTPIDWRQPYTLLYGLFISPSAHKVVVDQEFTAPWNAFWLAASHPSSSNTIDLVFGSVYLFLFIAGARQLWQLRGSYFLYTAITVIVAFSYSTGLPYSYMGLLRHCLLAFPLALLVATAKRTKLWEIAIIVMGTSGLFGLSLLYVWKIVWVP